MINVIRYSGNPILVPNKEHNWEKEATFNGSVLREKGRFHLVYRAMSSSQCYFDKIIKLSSIGYGVSNDGINFENRRLLITPEYKWKQFGCEDPRLTFLNNKYFIFFTALANFPPQPKDIRIGVAITTDFEKINQEHQVTFFNSKAMALFPEKIKGKITAILTVNTDKPPAKIALAFFNQEKDIWSPNYWKNWLPYLDKYSLPLQRSLQDHMEVGAVPIKTAKGWLLIYSYIKNYFSSPRIFGIEAVLLDLENPLKIIARTNNPILVPEEEYELFGQVPNVIFPSGALIQDEYLYIYYGAADTTLCLAKLKTAELLEEMIKGNQFIFVKRLAKKAQLERYSKNPIIVPKQENSWENQYTLNPGAIYEDNKVHLIYRAMGKDNTSVLGYALSSDGFHIDQRLPEPIYVPREDFEKKLKKGNSGCEDPRITKLGDKFYMCYTAFDGQNPTKVALTSITVANFLKNHWFWTKPTLISDPARNDKNACLLSEKINGKFILFHRIGGCIWLDFREDLNFLKGDFLGGKIILYPRPKKWDSRKIGIAAPPIKTSEGWLLIFHGLSLEDNEYRLGAALLDLKKPDRIISRLDYPILEPEAEYEKKGLRPGTVFSCGAVVINKQLIVYYGAADQVVGASSIALAKLLKELKKYKL